MAKAKTEKKETDIFGELDSLIQSQFKNVIDLSKVDGKVSEWYDTGIYSLNYAMSRNLRKGVPAGRVTSFSGLKGCLFDNTKIKINRGKRTGYREYTIKDIFNKIESGKWDKNIPSNTFSYMEDRDGIFFNEIKRVYDSGEKECFELITETGKSIIVSEEHPFKVKIENDRGIKEKDNFVSLKNLIIGEEVMVKSLAFTKMKEKKGRKKRREIDGLKYHPYSWEHKVGKYSYGRNHFARLVIEANMNNLEVSSFIQSLKYDEKTAKKFSFLLPEQIVHHVDENPMNDIIENLQVLTKKEHDSIHSKNGIKALGHNNYHYEKIKSIESVGIKHTYDIEMNQPYGNFVADNFIVHNTGKSLLAATVMRDPQLDMIILLETEGGGNAKELIEFAGVDTKKIRILKAHTFGNYKINKKTNKIDDVADNKFPVKTETPENLYVEGATRLVKKMVNALQFNEKFSEAKILIILDSLGNLQTVREYGGTPDMGMKGQKIGQFFRTFDTAFEKSNIAFLFTNKLYTNLGNIYDPWKETGGVNAEYNPSVSVRFSELSANEEISDKDMTAEKDRRKTSLGSSLKSIRGSITKSRFGTERRNAWFVLDAAVGPVKHSGLFTLLKDFGLMKKSGSRYTIPGWNKDNSFYKKEFISILLKDEDKAIDTFQSLLDAKEAEMKEAKRHIQVNDIAEINEIDDEYETEDMLSAMEKDVEG